MAAETRQHSGNQNFRSGDYAQIDWLANAVNRDEIDVTDTKQCNRVTS